MCAVHYIIRRGEEKSWKIKWFISCLYIECKYKVFGNFFKIFNYFLKTDWRCRLVKFNSKLCPKMFALLAIRKFWKKLQGNFLS